MHLLYFRFWHRVMEQLGLVFEKEPVQAAGHAGHRQRAGRPEDVEALGQRGRSPAPSSTASAPTPCGCSCSSRPRPRRTSTGPTSRSTACSASCPASGASSTPGRTCFLVPDRLLADVAGPFLELRRKTHRTIKRVTEGLEGDLKFNTAIAALMELVNELYALEPAGRRRPGRREGGAGRAGDAARPLRAPRRRGALARGARAGGARPAARRGALAHLRPGAGGGRRRDHRGPGERQAARRGARCRSPPARPRCGPWPSRRTACRPTWPGKTVRKVVFVPRRLINFVVT